MTIREELKEKLRKNKEKIQKDSKEFINDFLIPTFRTLSDECPLSDYLVIYIIDNNGKISCEANEVQRKFKKSVDTNVVYEAAKIVNDYDIDVDFRTEDDLELIIFSLNLKK